MTAWAKTLRGLAALAALGLAGAATAQFESDEEYRSVGAKRASVHADADAGSEVLWRMWKFMPVQVVAYRGDWLKIRDLDGDEGWMRKEDLSDIPTVMVKTKEGKLRKSPGGPIVWILDRGYPLRVFGAKGEWLEVSDLSSASGWLHKSVVWGSLSAERPGSRL